MKIRKHYTLSDVEWQDKGTYRDARVEIQKGESIDNPVCPTCHLYGPMVIAFRQYTDGGIDATIIDGSDGHAG